MQTNPVERIAPQRLKPVTAIKKQFVKTCQNMVYTMHGQPWLTCGSDYVLKA